MKQVVRKQIISLEGFGNPMGDREKEIRERENIQSENKK